MGLIGCGCVLLILASDRFDDGSSRSSSSGSSVSTGSGGGSEDIDCRLDLVLKKIGYINKQMLVVLYIIYI